MRHVPLKNPGISPALAFTWAWTAGRALQYGPGPDWLETVSVVFALAYLALAIRQSLLCWPAALISTAAWMLVVFDARLYMDAALQVFYFAMAIYGWIQWRRGGAAGKGVTVHWWRWSTHLIVLLAILLASLASAWLLRDTDAAFPFVDSWTTIAAVVTTFMVTRKVIENWIYWFVIDGVSIYLYSSRGMYLTALLFVLYVVLVVFGYRRWRRHYRAARVAVAA